MVMRRGDDSEFKDKMSKKNKELSEYLDEIKVNVIIALNFTFLTYIHVYCVLLYVVYSLLYIYVFT